MPLSVLLSILLLAPPTLPPENPELPATPEATPELDPFTEEAAPAPATEAAPPSSYDPCGHVPDDVDHMLERQKCLQSVTNPVAPAPAPSGPVEVERAPRAENHARSRWLRDDEYERGLELESKGRGLIIGGIIAAVGGVVMITAGKILQVRDLKQYENELLAHDSSSFASGPPPQLKVRGVALMVVGSIALVPLAHGLIIPGAFMLTRGRNLQNRASFGLRPSGLEIRF